MSLKGAPEEQREESFSISLRERRQSDLRGASNVSSQPPACRGAGRRAGRVGGSGGLAGRRVCSGEAVGQGRISGLPLKENFKKQGISRRQQDRKTSGVGELSEGWGSWGAGGLER